MERMPARRVRMGIAASIPHSAYGQIRAPQNSRVYWPEAAMLSVTLLVYFIIIVYHITRLPGEMLKSALLADFTARSFRRRQEKMTMMPKARTGCSMAARAACPAQTGRHYRGALAPSRLPVPSVRVLPRGHLMRRYELKFISSRRQRRNTPRCRYGRYRQHISHRRRGLSKPLVDASTRKFVVLLRQDGALSCPSSRHGQRPRSSVLGKH